MAKTKTSTVRFIRYGMTKNLGNYESERIDVEIVAEPREDFDKAVKRARGLCLRALQDTERSRKAKKAREVLKKHNIEPEDLSFIPDEGPWE